MCGGQEHVAIRAPTAQTLALCAVLCACPHPHTPQGEYYAGSSLQRPVPDLGFGVSLTERLTFSESRMSVRI